MLTFPLDNLGRVQRLIGPVCFQFLKASHGDTTFLYALAHTRDFTPDNLAALAKTEDLVQRAIRNRSTITLPCGAVVLHGIDGGQHVEIDAGQLLGTVVCELSLLYGREVRLSGWVSQRWAVERHHRPIYTPHPIEPSAYLVPERFRTHYDSEPSNATFGAEMRARGLRISGDANQIIIAPDGKWSAKLRDGAYLVGLERIGEHACTADLLAGFLAGPAEIVVPRWSDDGHIVETVIKPDPRAA